MTHLSIQKHQSGAALVIGLVILLVMTLLGVSSMNTTRTELKIAGNIQSHSTAFQTAEAGIQQLLTNTATAWANITAPQSYTYNPVSTNNSATMTMTFEDCRKNPLNYDLSGEGIGDGKGGNFKSTVHSVSSAGVTTNDGGAVIANSTVVVGIATVLAGCTPPAAP